MSDYVSTHTCSAASGIYGGRQKAEMTQQARQACKTGQTQQEVRTDYHFSITVRDENGMPSSTMFPIYGISHTTKQLLVDLLEGNPDVEEVSTHYL